MTKPLLEFVYINKCLTAEGEVGILKSDRIADREKIPMSDMINEMSRTVSVLTQ